ncbi:MAG: electron transfer flavoprotein subunit alpha, partial [Actinomycetota bacterium]|nr:electron transfer flavoprotein subunit alpha [Actinomycetota bacterium]
SFKGIMAAKSKPVETLGVADLGLTAGDVGKTGAREEVSSVREAEARAAGAVVVDEGDAFNKVVEYLEQIKVI